MHIHCSYFADLESTFAQAITDISSLIPAVEDIATASCLRDQL